MEVVCTSMGSVGTWASKVAQGIARGVAIERGHLGLGSGMADIVAERFPILDLHNTGP